MARTFLFTIALTSLALTALSNAKGICLLEDFYHRLEAEGAALTKSSAQPPPWGRTLTTAHFGIHYALVGDHAVRWAVEDSALQRRSDSLYTDLVNANSSTAEQRLYQIVDSLGWGHPLYVQKNGEHFEAAYDHYVNTMGMNAPVSVQTSQVYGMPPQAGHYHVELVDIGTHIPAYRTLEVYALTYPPGNGGGILMENDFLFNGRTDTITAVYSGVAPSLVNNYSLLWEEGIRVTASHEFYHSEQYTYTPTPSGFHFWYEAAATAMEEKLAGDVNDYLQYLPTVFNSHSTRGVNYYCSSCIHPYGNGIFHTYLALKLGEAFDRDVWEILASDNNIDNALATVIGAAGEDLRSIMTGYVQPFIFNQDTASSPFTIHNTDMDLWPRLSVPASRWDTVGVSAFTLPPLTYEFVEFTGNFSSQWGKVVRFTSGADISVTTIYSGQTPAVFNFDTPDSLLLTPPLNAGSHYILLVNGSWTQTANFQLEAIPIVDDSTVSVFPNPVDRRNGANLYFTRPGSLQSPVTITVYNARGYRVTEFSLDPSQSNWSWNLQSDGGNTVSSGIYYYQIDGGALRAFLVLNGTL